MTTVELAHDVTGAGPLLILLHGITESRRAWDPLLPALAADFRVVRVDLRGHGDSPDADGYEQQDYADDVAELLDRVGGGEAPLVIGHCLGGMVATVFAARYTTRGVINLDQPLDLLPLQAGVQQAEAALRGDGTPVVIAAIFQGGRGTLSDAEYERLVAMRRPSQQVVLGSWSMLLDTTPEELASATDRLIDGVSAPYLAIHGTDPGPGYAQWVGARIPGAVVEVWDGDGHHPHLAEPDRFLRRLRAFAADAPAVSADSV